MITIIDYGMGNLGSVGNMFKRIGVPAEITSDIARIEGATKLLLPGVGAFDAAMSRIGEMGLREILNRKAMVERVPVLGICLGMQLLTESSEEGVLPGLGWIKGNTLSFHDRIAPELRIPHMGWNIAISQKATPMVDGFEGEQRFYFVHSYFVVAKDPSDSQMKTRYGVEFDSAVVHDNIWGAQFHPEKSHKFGMRLFENFAKV
jgi:glutamine amidotransferase